MREEDDGQALFFSPTKIQTAQHRMDKKEKGKDEAIKAKEAEKQPSKR